jgi:hypothetical protein
MTIFSIHVRASVKFQGSPVQANSTQSSHFINDACKIWPQTQTPSCKFHGVTVRAARWRRIWPLLAEEHTRTLPEVIMQRFGSIYTSLRTEFRHAWFPTVLISIMVILHDTATGIRHGGLTVALLIAALMLCRPALFGRQSPLESWRHSLIYAVTIFVATLVSLGTLDWLNA